MLTNDLQVLILAGGTGTRLKSAVADVPKPMAPIQGKPFLEYQVRFLNRQGFRRFLLLTGHMAEVIENYFGDGSAFGVEVIYNREQAPLGTGGAIAEGLARSDGEFVLACNGDSLLVTNFSAFLTKARGPVSLAVHHQPETSRYGRVRMRPDGAIESFEEKQASAGPGWINAGIYLLQREFALAHLPQGRSSFEQDCLPLATRMKSAYAVQCQGRFLDIGLPETFKDAQTLIPDWIR